MFHTDEYGGLQPRVPVLRALQNATYRSVASMQLKRSLCPAVSMGSHSRLHT